MSLGKRIFKARTKLGLNQAEAAKEWGINFRTLQNWEIDHRTPSGFTLKQLQKLLDEILGSAPTKRKPR